MESGDFNRSNWQTGSGLTVDGIKHEGMSSDEIQQILQKKTHPVVPVIASDQIATLAPMINQKTREFGFVINTDDHTKPGHHWRSIFIDRSNAEIDYYDSLVSEPSVQTLKGIKILVEKMDDPVYFKLKINRIKSQSDKTSTCGAFALRFLEQRMNGRPFKEASGFVDEHVKGEKGQGVYLKMELHLIHSLGLIYIIGLGFPVCIF